MQACNAQRDPQRKPVEYSLRWVCKGGVLVGYVDINLETFMGVEQKTVPGTNPHLETFMGVDQRTGEGSKPRIPLVVSKSDRDHGTATTAIEPLG